MTGFLDPVETLSRFGITTLSVVDANHCVIGVWIWSQSISLSFIIAAAMVISMILAGIAGASIPLLLTVFRQDPA